MGPAIEDVGSNGTVAQRLFIYQFLPIPYGIQVTAPMVPPRLDRDGGIAYLAENMCGGPLGEENFLSLASSSHRQTHGGT